MLRPNPVAVGVLERKVLEEISQVLSDPGHMLAEAGRMNGVEAGWGELLNPYVETNLIPGTIRTRPGAAARPTSFCGRGSGC